jgi:hypothetical protein
VAGYRQAQDTFVMEIDGIPHGVTKGAVLAEDHPVVKHDMANGGLLFAPLDLSEDQKPRSAPKGEPPQSEPARTEPPKTAKSGKGSS